MKEITLHTPYGEEVLYQTTLNAAVEHLAEKLSPRMEFFLSLPITAQLAERMLSAAHNGWEEQLAVGETVYLEITPDALAGLGLYLPLKHLPDMPALSTPLELWGFAAAVAESVRWGLVDSAGIRVCPLYVENALNLAL